MSASISALQPEMQAAARTLDAVVHNSGLQGRFTSTLRTHAEQQRLYDKYLRGESQFPAAPPGESAHEYGYAFDYVVSPWEYQPDVGAYWESGWEYFEGGIWGGNADPVHFEWAGWRRYVQQESAGETVGQWIDRVWGYIPWWLSLFFPMALLTTEQTPERQKKLEKIAKSMGL
jgi:hypothetical protein